MIKVGIVRVLTTNKENILYSHEKILKEKFLNFEIETRCIPDQPEGIHNISTEKLAVPKIIKLAKEFEAEGKDAVFISCAADPGVKECRKELKIPVIGAGSSCAALALSMGQKVGILGITDEAPSIMVDVLQNKFIYNIKPDGVNTTLDLYDETGRKNTLKAAEILKKKGCDVIALGCTGLSTISIYKEISRNLHIKVIDAVIAAGTIISYLQF